MNDTTYYLDENLRSISAIITAQNKQIDHKKLSLFGEFNRPSKISKQSVDVINIHRSSTPVNYNSTKVSLQKTKFAINIPKTRLWKSSRVVPYHNNVFYFDDRSDLTVSDVLANRHVPTKKDNRNFDKIKSKRRSKCIAVIICLFAILIILIITISVLVTLLLPSKT